MLPKEEIKILNLLMFDEDFPNILRESGITEKLAAAVLRILIKDKLVSPFEEGSSEIKKLWMYDVDNLYQYKYRITALGLKALEENKTHHKKA